ncbi:MAG: disulfide bond formation protein B [Rhodoferax sp.]
MPLDRLPLLSFVSVAPSRLYAGLSALCVGMLLFGLYLQHVVGLEPCPMCIVQRYLLVLVALGWAWSAWMRATAGRFLGLGFVMLCSVLGAFVAARQSWLQWYPPEVVSCGRDLYGMIATFPLERVLPMVFRGGGDCSKVDWTFLGGTIANWSFVWFVFFALIAAVHLWKTAVGQRNRR